MDILVDTHILLWFFAEPEKLNKKMKKFLLDDSNSIYYSIISMWEVSIKHNIGKLPISGTEFMHLCEQSGFRKLPYDDRHIAALETLEIKSGTPPHKDPFDLALLAQAKGDGMLLITHDNKFSCFDEPYVVVV